MFTTTLLFICAKYDYDGEGDIVITGIIDIVFMLLLFVFML